MDYRHEQLTLAFALDEPSITERHAPRVRVGLVSDVGPPSGAPIITSSSAAYDLIRGEASRWDRERFLTILLDNKHHLLGVEEVSVGTLSQTLVHPREVFKAIILTNAAAFLAIHNHPSGDPTPSREDIEITRRLREVANIFGVRFLDHVVVGSDRYVSFVDDGYW